MRVYFLRERFAGRRAGVPTGLRHVPRGGGPPPETGIMGGDIAAMVRAARFSRWTVHDRFRRPGRGGHWTRAATPLSNGASRAPGAAAAARRRLVSDEDGAAAADLVIEAIAERPAAKTRVVFGISKGTHARRCPSRHQHLEPVTGPACRGACVSVKRFSRPAFFSTPWRKLPLVEVVRGQAHPPSRSSTGAAAFATAIGKLAPCPARDHARASSSIASLAPYFAEALLGAIATGMPWRTIDRAAEDFGMPTGPIETCRPRGGWT